MGPELQTVSRAEFEAIYYFLRVLEWATGIQYINTYSDCKAVVDGFAKGRELTLMGDMGALWYEVWEMYRRVTNSGDRTIVVHKVKGHCSNPAITLITHQKGNWWADFHAGQSACDIPEKEAEEILKKDRELWAIQEWLIDILCMQEGRTVDLARETIWQPCTMNVERATQKGHAVEKVGAHYYCMRCGQSWRPKDTRRPPLSSRGDVLGWKCTTEMWT